jgi:hypothetical protein
MMGKGKMPAGIWWGNLTQRAQLENLGVDRRIILKWLYTKYDGRAWIELVSFRIGTSGGLVKAVMEFEFQAGNFLTI